MKTKILIGVLLLALAGFAFWRMTYNKTRSSEVLGISNSNSINSKINENLKKTNLESVGRLIEIDKNNAIVVEIIDKEKLVNINPVFNRAYNGDLIVFFPDKTIVFDPLTSTIRDIMSESFYEEAKNIK